MTKFGRGGITFATLALVAALSSAQDAPKAVVVEAEALRGEPAVDILTVDGGGLGLALRHGGVVPGTVRVTLDGRTLIPTEEFAVDLEPGVVYLKMGARAGMSVTVSYRFDEKAATTGVRKAPSFGTFSFALAGGKIGVLGGLGLTERASDGSVMRGNAFGLRNSFGVAGGNLSGVAVYGQRQRVRTESGLAMNPDAKGTAPTDEGAGKFLLQNFTGKLMGGGVTIDYQEVSKNFAAFGQVAEAGVASDVIARLGQEKGLTRLGFGVQGAKIGGLALSQNFRTVKDENGSIDWRTYGVKAGGLTLDYSGRRVDQGFNRFKDIREDEREQLMKEKGMSRQNFSGGWDGKGGRSLGFTSSSIVDDTTGDAIERREASLDVGKLKFNLGDQKIAKGFGRFDSLLNDERGRYGREAGLSRQWSSLDASLAKDTSLGFSQSLFRGEKGGFLAQEAGLKGKGWSVAQTTRAVQGEFASLGAMAEGEMDSHIKSIATMYGGVASRPEDRGAFAQSPLLTRRSTRAELTPSKNFRLAMDRLELRGAEGGGSVDNASLRAGKLQIEYRKQSLGKDFSELSRLMEFEKNRLGQVAGLERTDWSARMDLRGSAKLQVTSLAARTEEGTVKRTNASYEDKKLLVAFNAREVDAAFSGVSGLVDAERDLLTGLKGFTQKDLTVKWRLNPAVSLDLFRFDAANVATGEERLAQNLRFLWKPDGKSDFGYRREENRVSGRDGELNGRLFERFDVKRNFGRYGTLALASETVRQSGLANDGSDSRRHELSYETKLNSRTSIRTDQMRTAYADGGKENISANTLSTELSKRTGVSVTDTRIDRGGDDRDETKRNYGVWFDLGNGMRFSWGYARHLNGDENSSMTNTVGLGRNVQPGMQAQQVQGVERGRVGAFELGGGYGANGWDKDSRTQSFANVGLATARPIRLGPFRDVQLKFAYDAAADRSAWSKENRFASFTGKLLGLTVGYDYTGQMHQNGYRGIDRTFHLLTDPSEKAWLRGKLFYKVRTLPWDDQVMIRDIDVTVRPLKRLEVTNQVKTNPEVLRGDAFLGSVPQDTRVNKWMIDWKSSTDLTFGGSWEQLINENSGRFTATAGFNLVLWNRSGSPVKLFWGMEEQSGTGLLRQQVQRYSFQYDQKAGRNQTFSLFAGNIAYEHNIAEGLNRNNWTVRMDWQVRF